MTVSTLDQQPAINSRERTYEGWAIVDVLGHARHAGYVTTEYFGQTAFFHVVTPQRDERERVIERDDWINGLGGIPKGSRVLEGGCPAADRFIGAGSVYGFEPVTKERAMEEIEAISPRKPLSAIDPDGKVIEPPKPSDEIPW